MRAPVNLYAARVHKSGRHGRAPSLDFNALDGHVYAPESGRLYRVWEPRGCGHGFEVRGLRATHVVCHLAAPVRVANGAYVAEGTLLGRQGYSGHTIPKGPRGAHVHWQINRGDWAAIWREVGLGAWVRSGRAPKSVPKVPRTPATRTLPKWIR